MDEIDADQVLMSMDDYENELNEQRAVTLKRLNAFPLPFVSVDGKQQKRDDDSCNYDHNSRELTKD